MGGKRTVLNDGEESRPWIFSSLCLLPLLGPLSHVQGLGFLLHKYLCIQYVQRRGKGVREA